MIELKNQECPLCHKKTLTLREEETDIPYFGRTSLFSMSCQSCLFKKSDVMAEEEKEPVRYSVEINGLEDLKIKIVKSSQATVKIPHLATIEPGIASEGFITNAEGLLQRVKEVIQSEYENEEDEDSKKKAKNLLKKLSNILVGREKVKIIIEDPSGNSAILSEKAAKERLKK